MRDMDMVPENGLTVLIAPQDPTLDIVFVHGFTGHPQQTWTDAKVATGRAASPSRSPCDSGEVGSNAVESRPARTGLTLPFFKTRRPSPSTSGCFWPQTILPETAPSARIITFGYDTNIRHRLQGQISQNTVYDIAKDLLVSLSSDRAADGGENRPVVFVAHSLGGIVVKELLRQSQGLSKHQRHLHTVYLATRGIIFFGTPHGGSDPRGVLQHVVEKVIRVVGFSVNKSIVDTLLPTSERLRELRDDFGPMAHHRRWLIHSFQEQYGIAALGGAKVVEDVSSCLGDAMIEVTEHISSNHMDMCRFSSIENRSYVKVASALRRIMHSCHSEAYEVLGDSVRLSPMAEPGLPIATWLTSLRFPEMYSRENTVAPAHDATCAWLAKRQEFMDWFQSNDFLWIMGNPGTGKSTIIKYLLEHVRSEIRPVAKTTHLASFFFHNRGAELEKSVEGMYRTLLHQMLKTKIKNPHLLGLLEETHLDPTESEETEWALPLLEGLLLKCLTLFYRGETLICFIDALDECDDQQARELVSKLQQAGRLAAPAGVRFLVCISSRHYPHISIERRYLVVLEKTTEHYTDIARFLDTELRIGQGHEQGQARQRLIDKSGGSFLWVVLVTSSLNHAYDRGNMEALQSRMSEIPGDVARLFADLLVKETDNQADTLNCLTWVLYSSLPMYVDDLYTAILRSRVPPEPLTLCKTGSADVKSMERFIVDCARGLVEMTGNDQEHAGEVPKVQFIHETVVDFLDSDEGLSRHYNIGSSEFKAFAHARLAFTCLDYLETVTPHLHWSDRPFGSHGSYHRNPFFKEYPFSAYSFYSGVGHARRGAGAETFFESLQQSSVRSWVALPDGRAFFNAEEIPKIGELVLLGIKISDNPFARAFWLIPYALSEVDSLDTVRNNVSLATLEISMDPTWFSFVVNKSDGFEFLDGILAATGSLSPTCFAVRIIDLVHIHQPRVGLPGERLTYAALSHHPTLLSFFVAAGVEDIVRPLLSSPMFDVNARHYTGRTPLIFAIERNHVQIVRLILDTGRADLCLQFEGRNLLMTAVLAGHEDLDVIRLLLDQEQVRNTINDISPVDGNTSVLANAIDGGHRAWELVRLLLAVPGIDINGCKFSRSPPLHRAVQTNAVAVLEMLLAHPDIDQNLLDSWGDTAAMRVLGRPPGTWARPIIEALVRSPKVDISKRDACGLTLLDRAIEDDDTEVVTLLDDSHYWRMYEAESRLYWATKCTVSPRAVSVAGSRVKTPD